MINRYGNKVQVTSDKRISGNYPLIDRNHEQEKYPKSIRYLERDMVVLYDNRVAFAKAL